ncbi:hypothetical protein OOT46_03750 [Aquabacterium sp. A7-Y]|uniref:hypothetical protein n=1 Tax=Aquabacterium sp. A7-Y TaxID=1349605 RepID=UPI00223D221B|nr:hypothetical protein [Aquabacterium sp. A7-Y]MCW7536967.1 hypothetical protein [Aquabacterium sp. A7-Y]
MFEPRHTAGPTLPCARRTNRRRLPALALAGALAASTPVAARADTEPRLFRCPNNRFTNVLSQAEASARRCRLVDAPAWAPKTRPEGSRRVQADAPPAVRGAALGVKVSREEQRARDADARHILEAELSREEAQLAALRREHNGGSPLRRSEDHGDPQYRQRTLELGLAVSRKESDIASIRRELAKLQPRSSP